MNNLTPAIDSPEGVMSIVAQVEEWIDKQGESYTPRILPRRRLVQPLRIQLLDQDLQPCSSVIEAISQDVSMDGMGLICNVDVTSPFARIQFSKLLGEHPPLIIQVRHSTMIGPYCLFGGQYFVNWTESDNGA